MGNNDRNKFIEIEAIYNGMSIESIIKEYKTGSGYFDAYYDPKKQNVSNFNIICVIDPNISFIDAYNKKADPFIPYTHFLRRKDKKHSPEEIINTMSLKPFNTFVKRPYAKIFERNNPQAKNIARHINLFVDTISDVFYLKAPDSIQTFEKTNCLIENFDQTIENYAKFKLDTMLKTDNFNDAKKILRHHEKEQLLHISPSLKYQIMPQHFN